MISYLPAPKGHETLMVVDEMIAAYHPELQRHEVTIGVDLAHVPEGEALKAGGREALAYVKRTPTRQRQRGQPDAIITINYTYYCTLTPEEQAGLIDHELAHLLVKLDANDAAEVDAAGRPVLEMRKHDVEFGWFLDVAERHGDNSHEVKQAHQIAEGHGQLLFSWAESPFPPKSWKRQGE